MKLEETDTRSAGHSRRASPEGGREASSPVLTRLVAMLLSECPSSQRVVCETNPGWLGRSLRLGGARELVWSAPPRAHRDFISRCVSPCDSVVLASSRREPHMY